MGRRYGYWFALVLVAVVAPAGGCKEGDVNFDGGLFDDFDDDAGLRPDAGPDGGSVPAPDGALDAATADAATADDDAGDEPAASSDRQLAEQWPARLATAICGALEDCLGSQLLVDAFGGRDCAQLREQRLRSGDLGSLPASVEAQSVLLFGDELPDCLADVRALGCDVESSRLPATCELAILGTAELGEACGIDADCEGAAYCNTEDSCPGRCEELRAQGMSCTRDDDAQCAHGLTCFCAGADCPQGATCEPLGALGDECEPGVLPACAPGTVCLQDGVVPRCGSLSTLYFKMLDEPCDVTSELCEEGLVCESASGTAGVCRPPVDSGEACRRAEPNQCPSEEYCDAENPGEDGTCLPRPGDGSACLDRSVACADEHVCIEGTCRALRANGEACSFAGECYSGVCLTGSCAPARACVP